MRHYQNRILRPGIGTRHRPDVIEIFGGTAEAESQNLTGEADGQSAIDGGVRQAFGQSLIVVLRSVRQFVGLDVNLKIRRRQDLFPHFVVCVPADGGHNIPAVDHERLGIFDAACC
jgi:hypothetical protein